MKGLKILQARVPRDPRRRTPTLTPKPHALPSPTLSTSDVSLRKGTVSIGSSVSLPQRGVFMKTGNATLRPMSTYRNPWHKPNDPPGSEFFTTDAKPVQVGRYQRFHRIKSYTPDGNVY